MLPEVSEVLFKAESLTGITVETGIGYNEYFFQSILFLQLHANKAFHPKNECHEDRPPSASP